MIGLREMYGSLQHHDMRGSLHQHKSVSGEGTLVKEDPKLSFWQPFCNSSSQDAQVDGGESSGAGGGHHGNDLMQDDFWPESPFPRNTFCDAEKAFFKPAHICDQTAHQVKHQPQTSVNWLHHMYSDGVSVEEQDPDADLHGSDTPNLLYCKEKLPRLFHTPSWTDMVYNRSKETREAESSTTCGSPVVDGSLDTASDPIEWCHTYGALQSHTRQPARYLKNQDKQYLNVNV
jgi:hypothetical protein